MPERKLHLYENINLVTRDDTSVYFRGTICDDENCQIFIHNGGNTMEGRDRDVPSIGNTKTMFSKTKNTLVLLCNM